MAVQLGNRSTTEAERDFPGDDNDPDHLVSTIPEDTPHIPYQPLKRSDDEILERSREFYDLMAKRRTVRAYSTEAIPQEVLENIIKTAGTAPSGAHTEPWTFVLVQDAETKAAIRDIIEEEEYLNYSKKMSRQWVTDLTPFHTNHIKEYLSDAPALVLVFRQTYSWTKNGKKSMHYYSDMSVSIAVGILLAAVQEAYIQQWTSSG
ncbi:iodotyrosine deiodinase 1 [Hyposmocoma kahamanoa]|uniref:iodotyrosine deiodinase 1 n=1 Tax=Hyposmocoma kahamanoa TaxID=1477025 RepID=UPI000E6D6FAC|nr:iodotyrosine deiodinase 1 [Hyposmocoma kahamanoa]